MRYAKILASLVIVMGVCAHIPVALAASHKSDDMLAVQSPASTVVEKFYTVLVDTMKQGSTLGFAGRYKKMEPVIKASFNLPLMTRMAVGLVWSKATVDEQQQLISAFSDFSVANYASQFSKYDGEKFDIIGEEPAAGGGVIVETKLTPREGGPVALNYLMRQDENGKYRIVDVFLDATISELATRRAEFTSIVNHDGFEALVNTLGEKSRQMGPS